MSVIGIDFWKESTRELFDEILEKMIEKGFEKDEAVELLENLYYAVGDEYGN